MLTDEQIFHVQRCRRKRYSAREICRTVGITEQQLQDFISQQLMKMNGGEKTKSADPTPEEIAERAAYYKQRHLDKLRGQGEGEYRERMPRHYWRVKELVNARGWGLSQSGRLRYSQQMQDNALRFGWKPPIGLLEWMMGFPENHTHIELAPSGMPLSLQQPSGLEERSLTTITDCKVTLSEQGLLFEKDLTYEEWERVGHELFRVETAWHWWVGDWINYGDNKYGETYKAAIEVTGRSCKTLMNVSSVAKKFKISRRRENLPFAHHAEVASEGVESQDALLDLAEAECLSKNCLRVIVATPVEKRQELIELARRNADGRKLSVRDFIPTQEPKGALTKSESDRLIHLRQMIEELEPGERALVREWLELMN